MLGRKIQAEGIQAGKYRKRWLGNAGQETQDKKSIAGNTEQEMPGRTFSAGNAGQSWLGKVEQETMASTEQAEQCGEHYRGID